MTRPSKYILIGLTICFCHLTLFAQKDKTDSLDNLTSILKPFIINSDTAEGWEGYDLSRNVQFLLDTANRFNISDIISDKFSKMFIPYPIDSKGGINWEDASISQIQSKVYWYRFSIRSNLTRDKDWLLFVSGDYCSLFIPDTSNNFTILKTGAKLPLKDRDFKQQGKTAMNLLLHHDREQIFYLRIESNEKSNSFSNWGLKSKENFLEGGRMVLLFRGPFIGIFLIMVIYNLILFFTIKEKSYLFYVFYILGLGLFYITWWGYGTEFIWPNHPEWGAFARVIFILSFLFFYVLFGKTYLNTKTHLPKWDVILKIQMAGLIAILLLTFLPKYFPEWAKGPAIVFFLLSSFIIVLLPAIFCLRKGFRPAKYFLLANLMLLCGLILEYVIDFSFVSWTRLGVGLQIGSVMEIIFFSIGIGDRVNVLNKEKEEAQEKALEVLEVKVKERTTEVVKQKHIIEEKNKDITDSINYAKRIQQAKLPSKELIYSALPDCFVLFKPKDIVSGDFYYFHKTDKSVFIASADCTGHGVPGALMSMIGSEQLNDALAHSTDTSEILRHLNKGIKVSLHQTDSNESTRDGMDIALCSVDTDNRVVKYAGANRPIWIIRNGQTTVEEIKATKKAIGGFTEDNQHFDSHEIKLQQGDTFYISTDGYGDTFSGQGSKKLTTKKFKETLLDIQHKTMKEQEHHLDNFIENWKAGSEQVDDILVIGVRL